MRSTPCSVSFAVTGVITLVIGCGSGTEAGEDMTRDLDRVEVTAGAMRGELDRHENAIANASDLAAFEALEREHRGAMASPMDEGDHVLADMNGSCRHRESQERGRMQPMQAAMTDLRAELGRHHDAPRLDLASARAEENAHLARSRAALSRLLDEAAAMRHEAGSYRCTHGMH